MGGRQEKRGWRRQKRGREKGTNKRGRKEEREEKRGGRREKRGREKGENGEGEGERDPL